MMKLINWNNFKMVLFHSMLSLVATALTWLVYRYLHVLWGFTYSITPTNRGDYLSIFGAHCSTVFLTTSLMAMLSEKNIYVYWVDIVNNILILPMNFNFSALVTYSVSTILWAIGGFIAKDGPFVLVSFLLGLIFITALFVRMLSVYYGKHQHQKQIKEQFIKKIACECNKQKSIKEICGTNLRKLAEINILKAENRQFEDVYENLLFLESCISDIKNNYENLKEFGIVEYLEKEYTEMLKSLAVQYPAQIKEYVFSQDSSTSEENSPYALRWSVYPWILEAYPRIGRSELFFEALIQWTQWENQREHAKNYIINTARKNLSLITEAYSGFYSPIGDIDSDSAKVFMDALEGLFSVNHTTWQEIVEKNHLRYQILDCYKCEDANLDKGHIMVSQNDYYRIFSMLVEFDFSGIDKNTTFLESLRVATNLTRNSTNDNKSIYVLNYYLQADVWVKNIINQLQNEPEKEEKALALLESMIQSILKYRTVEEADNLLGYLYQTIETQLPEEVRTENSLELQCFNKIKKTMGAPLVEELYNKSVAWDLGIFFIFEPDRANIPPEKLDMLNRWLEKLKI